MLPFIYLLPFLFTGAAFALWGLAAPFTRIECDVAAPEGRSQKACQNESVPFLVFSQVLPLTMPIIIVY